MAKIPWNREQMQLAALAGATADYAAFEAIGLDEGQDLRVLDVGCFDGFNTLLKFSPCQNIAQVVGLDPCAEALDIARDATADPRFLWVEGTLDDFEDANGFDLVYLGHTFQHLPHKDQAAARIFELLRPGGFVVIKTVDDSLKASAPDPDRVMDQVFSLYEKAVRPHRPHTAHTDRNNGAKCHGLLSAAGFAHVRLAFFHGGTEGKTAKQREALFERLTYFRKTVPDAAPNRAAAQQAMDDLLARWHAMFLDPNYYFDSPTVMAIAQRPLDGSSKNDAPYHGPHFAFPPAPSSDIDRNGWIIAPMTEADLGEIMAIEARAFPSPWTPLAYVTELRHNPTATYVVARNNEGRLGGYIGWWEGGDAATIAHVACDDALRRQGIGSLLVDFACDRAARAGASQMQLQVRKANNGARAFYRHKGFDEVATSVNYYTNPDDDGIIMVRPLQP